MKVRANGIDIEVDVQGPADGPVIMLVMGLGMQLIAWPDELVQALVTQGFRVVRHDNRDIGLSQGFDAAGVPNLAWAMARHVMHMKVNSPYSLADMADDAFGVLDALGISAAHICGASMGGMIAQHMAVRAPERVKSLTLIMTTSGARRLPQASMDVRRVMMAQPASSNAADVLAHMKRLIAAIGSPAYPPEPERLQQRLEQSFKRAYHPAGTARQLLAIVADGDRTPMLSRIQAPTLVIHGEADALVPAACGRDLQRHIAGAQADFIPGMGHDLPLPLLPRIAQGLLANAARAPGG